ncbi:MAG TPA: phosphoribosylformylglycinamidine cyclo-ligase [Chloroflexota bacterium]|jgi:phosphoribosylformylglycinamidine cyclo-ligase|nr:phosphoribosylformylglycinamidine cyclo-ligase [Chloroflexota bacterium]
MSPAGSSYAAAGVDIAAAEENVRRISQHVRSTHGPQVLGDFGAFAGLFHLRDVRDPVLVASTDGVGTKVLLGQRLGRFDVLGRDLVNLSVDDVLTTGARPLFFLDYVGLNAIDHQAMEALVAGMAKACRENGCALLGGETAQLPELYAPGHMDLAGTVVGVVERDALIDGSRVQPGDRVWGLPSSGLHTNGFSLARRLVARLELSADFDARLGQSVGDALMAAHPSYYAAVKPLLGYVKSIAHITGGGIPGNLPRVLPPTVSVELDWGTWPVPPIFGLLQDLGRLPFDELWRVFNLGLGLIFVTAANVEPRSDCPTAIEVGRVTALQTDRVILRGRPS